MVSATPNASLQTPVPADAFRPDDEAFCRLALREGIPPLGLSLDEILRRARSERAA